MKFRNLVCCGLISFSTILSAKEFFVAPDGKDGNGGLLEANSFRTIQKGVDALKPGDMLTIFPGKYHEAVFWRFNGDSRKKTIVRAKYPGTVLIHGDIPVSGFKKVNGVKNCYALQLPIHPEAVNECDSLSVYSRRLSYFQGPDIASYGAYHYDEQSKTLFISTHDGGDPDKHVISISVIGNHGFRIEPLPLKEQHVENVEIDGLVFSGFNKRDLGAHQSTWGISILNPVNCRIRRCTAFMNAGGIAMENTVRSKIEYCSAYGNGTENDVSAGNIIIRSGQDSVIDNCMSFRSLTYGIRFYGRNINNILSNSISIGDLRGAIWIKPCDDLSKLSGIYSPDLVACRNSEYSVFKINDYDRSGKNGKTSLAMNKDSVVSHGRDFADPHNYDLRLQKGAALKKGFSGDNVFFISPNGKDEHDGRSIDTPWRTLKNARENSTVYFLPGKYAGGMKIDKNNVVLAGRGQNAPAVIQGAENGLDIAADNVTVCRLSFVGSENSAILCNGKDITIDRCGFSMQKIALKADSASGLAIRHSAFDRSVEKLIAAEKSDGVFAHNILMGKEILPRGFTACGNAYGVSIPPGEAGAVKIIPEFKNALSGDFSLKNEKAFRGRSLDGLSFGPYFFLYEPEDTMPDHLAPIQIGSTTASIGYTMRGMPQKALLCLKAKDAGEWSQFPDQAEECAFRSISVTGLTPGMEYQYYVVASPVMGYHLGNHYLPEGLNIRDPRSIRSPVLTFSTPLADRPSRVYHVAKNGNDSSEGTAASPFLTISQAAMKTLPGDTVIVHEGIYSETVVIPTSGTRDKPVTYQAAPGEYVWLDGTGRQMYRAFAVFGKGFLNFDGFRFKMYGTGKANSSGIFLLFGGNDISISRCFHDGRAPGYSPSMLHARNSRKISMRNSVSVGGMSSTAFVNSSEIVIENNVFKMPSIWTVIFYGKPDQSIRFANNIVTDNLRSKTDQAPLRIENLNSLAEENNIFFMRFPRDLRYIVEHLNDGADSGNEWEKIKLDEYYNLIARNKGSIFADPNIKALPKMLQWKNASERKNDMKKGIEFERNVNNYENARNPNNHHLYRQWDFSDFFASPPLFDGKGKKIGLDREQFTTFPSKPQDTSVWDSRR
ncbi:MAG: hypothetical protein BWY31_02494 [Lentisphaerae bacterium ADurb.Bin242]|nr:MAG: hypothetical protein BWY31_02494 [Lentisphaerae bacterium ADurb.Bin242]